MALFCAAIRRDSVSLLRFLFRSHIEVFSCILLLLLLSLFTPLEFFTSVLADGFIIIIIHSLELFTSASADGFSLESSGLFSVFWPFSIMLSFGWSPLVHQLPCPPVPLVTVPNAPITIGIIVTCMLHSFFNSLARSRYLSFFSHSFNFILWLTGAAKSTILQVLFFCWLLLSLVFWPGLGDPFVCPIGVYTCHFLGQVLGCAYTICLYGQI